MLENGNCKAICEGNQYREGDKCYPCKGNCASCSDGETCDTCRENLFLNNEKDCRNCYETCYNCTQEGNYNNHNCLSCKDNNFLVVSGIYKNNCVEACPKNTVKDDIYNICKYVEPGDISDENNENNSSSKSKLIVWIFVAIAAVLFIVFNIIFFGNICCCEGKKQDETSTIHKKIWF